MSAHLRNGLNGTDHGKLDKLNKGELRLNLGGKLLLLHSDEGTCDANHHNNSLTGLCLSDRPLEGTCSNPKNFRSGRNLLYDL